MPRPSRICPGTGITTMIKSEKDVVFGDRRPGAMSKKVRNFLNWLELTGYPNNDESWNSFCEMEANSE